VADQDQNQNGGQEQTAQISGTVKITPQGGEGAAQQGKPQDGKGEAVEESPEKKSKKKGIAIVVVLVLVVLAALFYWRSTYTEDTDDAQVDGDLYQVSSRVVGQVLKVYVEDNQLVHQGDPIADIDPRDLQVALAQEQADLANAQAEYEQARSNVPITAVNVRTNVSTSVTDVLGTQAGVLQAQQQEQAATARIAQAKANAVKAQLDVDRYTPLVQKDVISKQQYDAAVATALAATAAVDEAQKNESAQREMVRTAQQKVASSKYQEQQNKQNGPEQIKVQQARAAAALAAVQQAQAKVDQAKLNLGYGHIVAPITGIVNKKNVSAGANLSVGQDLLTIVPLDNLWVTANFKETQLQGIKQNQEVELKVDALGGRKFHGYIYQIGGATGSRLSLFPPENATGNYVKVVQRIPVRINFKNLAEEDKNHELRPGMSVTPDVRVKQ
jgi:membrane fusion protein (multidrug efflux system)